MTSQEHFSQLAVGYARALLELATERKQAESVGQDLAAIAQMNRDNPKLHTFLANPAVGETERADVIKKAFAGRSPELIMNFLLLLNTKRRLGILNEISAAYDSLLEEQLGKVEVDVIVAQKLGADQLEQVRQKVSAALKKDAVVHQYVDESIIGGLVVRVQDQVIDGSVKAQLAGMKRKLLSARAK